MSNRNRFFVHSFHNLESAEFSVQKYSRLKFGSDRAAREFGYELAIGFFNRHMTTLLSNKCVVIPSPYNYVRNAATIMTGHFCNKLNELLVNAQGAHVDCSLIHRKVSYTNDYGFMSKEQRKSLIDNDSFYLNKDFTDGKVLIFVDDIFITGTHENKLAEILRRDGIENKCFFVYYAQYQGTDNPEIEAALNFSAVKNVNDYIELTMERGHHIIVRPIKYILSQDKDTLSQLIKEVETDKLREIYHGCLGEGYYRIPAYQSNFKRIAKVLADRDAAVA